MTEKEKEGPPLDQIVMEFLSGFYREYPVTSWLGAMAVITLVASMFS